MTAEEEAYVQALKKTNEALRDLHYVQSKYIDEMENDVKSSWGELDETHKKHKKEISDAYHLTSTSHMEDIRASYKAKYPDGRKLPEIMTEERLRGFKDHLKLKDLKEFVANTTLPDEAPVLVERAEDWYFTDRNWDVWLVEGMQAHSAREWNKKLADGEITPEEYPGLYETPNHPFLTPNSEEDIKELCEQFYPAWCASEDKKDGIVLIFSHY